MLLAASKGHPGPEDRVAWASTGKSATKLHEREGPLQLCASPPVTCTPLDPFKSKFWREGLQTEKLEGERLVKK